MPSPSTKPTTDLVGLHQCRSRDELVREAARRIRGLLEPGRAWRLWVEDEFGGEHEVWHEGEPGPTASRVPLMHRALSVGSLQLVAPTPAEEERLAPVLAHLTTAIVNLKLHEDAYRLTDHLVATLQTLDEGVSLLDESDPDTIGARLLGLCNMVLGAEGGALLVRDEDRALRIAHVLGVPETLIEDLRSTEDTRPWPETVLDQPLTVVLSENGVLPGLEAGTVGARLQNVIASPVVHRGEHLGLYIGFNAALPKEVETAWFTSLERLCELAGAIYHRIELEERARRELRTRTQLEIASQIQQRLMLHDPPDVAGLEFAWRSRPAEQIGGDYLDVLRGDLGDVFAIVADVSGHGIDSALLMSAFRSAWRADSLWVPPHELLATLNRQVVNEVADTGMFVTATTLRFEESGDGSFDYANAGHTPLLILRADGTVEALESPSGPPIGFARDTDYETGRGRLRSGDKLVLLTDGVVESTGGPAGAMFGMDRLRATLAPHAGSSAGSIVEALFGALEEHRAGRSAEDDVSVLVIHAVAESGDR